MPMHAVEQQNLDSISANTTAPVWARIEEAAAWRGVPVGSFVIEAAVRAADEVLEHERLIQLSREDAERILALLENPPAPNAALRKAADAHQRLIRG